MTEKKGIPVPYVTAGLGMLLTLATAGIIWLVSTTNEVPAMKRDIANMQEDVRELKQDMRELRAAMGRRITP